MKKQKMTKKKLIITSLIIIVSLGIISVAFLLFNNSIGDNLKKAIGIKSTAPTFAFNEQVADGWWAADNYNSRENTTDDYAGDTPIDKLPVASRNIFQSKDTTVDSCFVMYAYYDYPADINALKKKRESAASTQSDLIYNKQSTQTLTIDTPEGTKSYELQQYGITGPGSEQMQRGMSWGYVELSDGYITIDGVCPEAERLSSTVLGMKSISLVR